MKHIDQLPESIPVNEREFEVFFRSHYPIMVSFAVNYIADRDQAEELVQEVFANVWHKADSITIASSAKSYLFTSVRNACLNFIKHQKIEQAYARDHAPQLSTTHEPVAYDELVARLEKALDKISPKCREIFELSRFEGKKYKEIAQELSLSIKTVENQMGKALKILREELGDYLPLILWLFTHGGKF